MLKRSIIIAVVICIPLAFYVASEYGKLEEVTFKGAVEKTMTDMEGDQAPKVIVVSKIEQLTGMDLVCLDANNEQFNVNYTGSEKPGVLTVGSTVRFVGHVHGGTTPTFHATQVYAP